MGHKQSNVNAGLVSMCCLRDWPRAPESSGLQLAPWSRLLLLKPCPAPPPGQYLLGAYYVLGSLPGAEDVTVEKTNWPFCEVGGIFHFDELMLKKGTGKVSVT